MGYSVFGDSRMDLVHGKQMEEIRRLSDDNKSTWCARALDITHQLLLNCLHRQADPQMNPIGYIDCRWRVEHRVSRMFFSLQSGPISFVLDIASGAEAISQRNYFQQLDSEAVLVSGCSQRPTMRRKIVRSMIPIRKIPLSPRPASEISARKRNQR
ncbi:hypothetical protein BJX68DRAFT_81820 [Aspergillus pseudodeflectus]|uniref:Uncharacterized protein n=1 Tax=Aspergillus pseudodeflectus TaxID=176178 RepID=A0ABR4L7D4_9EURO